MNTISIKLPEDLRRRLEVESLQQGLNRSQFVRRTLEQVLNRARTKNTPTCYELMREGCGVVRDAPRDLSSGRTHMRGYGR